MLLQSTRLPSENSLNTAHQCCVASVTTKWIHSTLMRAIITTQHSRMVLNIILFLYHRLTFILERQHNDLFPVDDGPALAMSSSRGFGRVQSFPSVLQTTPILMRCALRSGTTILSISATVNVSGPMVNRWILTVAFVVNGCSKDN